MLLSTLTLEYPAWYILLCLLLGAAYAVFMYFRDAVFKDPSKRLKRSLWFFGFLRFAVVSVIAFLLLSPFLKSRFTEEEKPIIVVAQDNSSSVLTTMTQDDSAKYTVALQAITDQLGSKYLSLIHI